MQRLYTLSGLVAGIMILAICVLIIAQIVARPLGLVLPGVDEFAISAFVAAIFLGLPYTLRMNGHVRADIVVKLLRPGWRRTVEIIVHAVAIAFVAYFVYFGLDLAWNSYLQASRYQGLLGSPLWIPQSVMVIGLALFGVALVDSLIAILRGDDDRPDEHTVEGYDLR